MGGPAGGTVVVVGTTPGEKLDFAGSVNVGENNIHDILRVGASSHIARVRRMLVAAVSVATISMATAMDRGRIFLQGKLIMMWAHNLLVSKFTKIKSFEMIQSKIGKGWAQ